MTTTRAGVAFAIAAFLFALDFALALAGVATGRVRLIAAGAFALAVGLLLTQ
jgi:hypothetical protein